MNKNKFYIGTLSVLSILILGTLVLSPSTNAAPPLSVSLTANPDSANIIPLSGVDLVANVSNLKAGDEIVYSFDCTNDGIFEHISTTTSEATYAIADLCTYNDYGIYQAIVKVNGEKGDIEATTEIVITQPVVLSVSLILKPSPAVSAKSEVELVADVSGLEDEGTFIYSFDCTNDGIFEHVSNKTSLITYEITDLCVYDDTGDYIVAVEAIFSPKSKDLNPVTIIATTSINVLSRMSTSGTVEIDSTIGGEVELVNDDNTEVTLSIDSDAVADEPTLSASITSLNIQNTDFEIVPEDTGSMISDLQYEIEVLDKETAQEVTAFEKPIIITISYLDSDIPLGFDESEFKINFFNEETSQWEELLTIVDTVNNIATAEVFHLTRFALVASAAPIITPPVVTPAPSVGGGSEVWIPEKWRLKVAPETIKEKIDFNGDSKINLVDFSILTYWYKKTDVPSRVDINDDNKVDLTEFSVLMYFWTK
jgi:hypothetical protein